MCHSECQHSCPENGIEQFNSIRTLHITHNLGQTLISKIYNISRFEQPAPAHLVWQEYSQG
jgi:hypothetical protein